MTNLRLIHKWLMTIVFSLLVTPIYFVAWWINLRGFDSSFTPRDKYYVDNWYIPLFIDRVSLFLPFVFVVCLLTTCVMMLTWKVPGWWIIVGGWFLLLGPASSFTLTMMWKAEGYSGGTIAGYIIDGTVLSLLTAIVPTIVGFLVSIVWLALGVLGALGSRWVSTRRRTS